MNTTPSDFEQCSGRHMFRWFGAEVAIKWSFFMIQRSLDAAYNVFLFLKATTCREPNCNVCKRTTV